MGQSNRRVRVLALVTGGPSDEAAIELACMLVIRKDAELFVVHPLVVARAMPLDAPLEQESEQARQVLASAQQMALRQGCRAQTREVRTRDAGMALVDEAADLGCDHIVLGLSSGGGNRAISEHVIQNAPCEVWVRRLVSQ